VLSSSLSLPRWHSHLDARLLQFCRIDLSDRWIFIDVFDQVPAFSRACLAEPVSSSTSAKSASEPFAVATPGWRDVPRWLGSGVEMLMEPAIGRNEQAPFDPINSLLSGCGRLRVFQRAFPHKRVAVPVEHDHVRPRTVTMRLFVSSNFKLRDVSLHAVV